jgi:hypothetical protein
LADDFFFCGWYYFVVQKKYYTITNKLKRTGYVPSHLYTLNHLDPSIWRLVHTLANTAAMPRSVSPCWSAQPTKTTYNFLFESPKRLIIE